VGNEAIKCRKAEFWADDNQMVKFGTLPTCGGELR